MKVYAVKPEFQTETWDSVYATRFSLKSNSRLYFKDFSFGGKTWLFMLYLGVKRGLSLGE